MASNRNLIYGAIAVVVVVLLIWMFAGKREEPVTTAPATGTTAPAPAAGTTAPAPATGTTAPAETAPKPN